MRLRYFPLAGLGRWRDAKAFVFRGSRYFRPFPPCLDPNPYSVRRMPKVGKQQSVIIPLQVYVGAEVAEVAGTLGNAGPQAFGPSGGIVAEVAEPAPEAGSRQNRLQSPTLDRRTRSRRADLSAFPAGVGAFFACLLTKPVFSEEIQQVRHSRQNRGPHYVVQPEGEACWRKGLHHEKPRQRMATWPAPVHEPVQPRCSKVADRPPEDGALLLFLGRKGPCLGPSGSSLQCHTDHGTHEEPAALVVLLERMPSSVLARGGLLAAKFASVAPC